jgi:sugar-specific transcriptional regulator TrmB
MTTPSKISEEILMSLGISNKEAKFYLALLQSGPSTVLPVARLAGLKRTSVYNFIDGLIQIGLVTYHDKNGRRYYRAENPEIVVKIFEERRQKINSALPNLLSLYKTSNQIPESRIFYGPQGIKQAILSSLECSEKKIYSIIDVDSAVAGVVGVNFWEDYIEEATRREIIVHSLRHRDEKVRLPEYKYLRPQETQKTLLVYRYLPHDLHLPNTILVYDNTVVVVSPPKENWAMVVESHSFADTMRNFHNILWKISR